IALLPPQDGAGGRGLVVRTARSGIQRATGWEPAQPLSGTRCLTREVWEACQPLAPGWGVETSLTIDALTGGFWVKEIECDLHHRATGGDLRSQLHRAAQLRDVLRALARRRHVAPPAPEDEAATGQDSAREQPPAAGAPDEEPSAAPARPAADPSDDDEEADAWSAPADDPAARARRRREALAALPITGELSDEHTRALGDVDLAALDRDLRALPVAGPFDPDDLVLLAGTDLGTLSARLRAAPVEGSFDPQHAVIIASHLDGPEPELPASITLPLTADEYTSLVIHA